MSVGTAKVALAPTDTVKKFVKELKEKGCKVEADWTAGTVKVFDLDGVEVYWALQKGSGGDWIVRCINSRFVEWYRD